MAFKSVDIDNIGIVKLYKRRNTKAIKLSINDDNQVVVSMPTWTPYKLGINFLNQNLNWISEHLLLNVRQLTNGSKIGKQHFLEFHTTDKLEKRAKILEDRAIVYLGPGQNSFCQEAQSMARKLCLKVLKREADQALPQRLEEMATKYDYRYSSVRTRFFKSRWGSCSNSQDIKLNILLMQLPWNLIDYVILHELVHTKYMSHGKSFWDELKSAEPDARNLRKTLANIRPATII